MAVPKKRQSHGRTRRRRSHHAIPAKNVIKCPKCGSVNLPHQTCSDCGYYKGKDILKLAEKLSKKEQKELRRKEKEAQKEKEQEQSKIQT